MMGGITRRPKARTVDDTAADAFIKGGGAPTPAVSDPKPKPQPQPDPAVRSERAPDTRTTPRFSIRLQRDLLDDIDGIIPAAKEMMRVPPHIRLSKSDFIEWAIREAVEKVRKSQSRKR